MWRERLRCVYWALWEFMGAASDNRVVQVVFLALAFIVVSYLLSLGLDCLGVTPDDVPYTF